MFFVCVFERSIPWLIEEMAGVDAPAGLLMVERMFLKLKGINYLAPAPPSISMWVPVI